MISKPSANEIHDKLGIWGIAYGIWDDPNIVSLLLSSGQHMFNADGTAIAVEDPQPVFDQLNRIKSMMDSGAIASMDEQADVSAAGQEGSPIVLGTEAMRYQWSNQIVSIYSAAGEDRNFVLYPLPRVRRWAVRQLSQAVDVLLDHRSVPEHRRSRHVHRLLHQQHRSQRRPRWRAWRPGCRPRARSSGERGRSGQREGLRIHRQGWRRRQPGAAAGTRPVTPTSSATYSRRNSSTRCCSA